MTVEQQASILSVGFKRTVSFAPTEGYIYRGSSHPDVVGYSPSLEINKDTTEYFGFDIAGLERRGLAADGEALLQSGYPELLPLLDVSVETAYLQNFKENLSGELDGLREFKQDRYGRVKELSREEVVQLRRRLEEKMAETGLRPSLRVFQPKELWGICAATGRGEFSSLDMTHFGQAVTVLQQEFPSLSIFLVAGIARDVVGNKPPEHRRETLPLISYQTRVIWSLLSAQDEYYRAAKYHGLEVALPPTDIDLLMVTGDESVDLSQMEQVLNKQVYPRRTLALAKTVPSSRRPGFTRLDFGTRGWHEWDAEGKLRHRRGKSLGHAFFPPHKGVYSPQNRLLSYLMAKNWSDIPVLLIPYGGLIWGVGTDFFGGLKPQNRRPMVRRENGNEYTVAYYPFPDQLFSRDNFSEMSERPLLCPVEALFNLGYMLRTVAWTRQLPIMRNTTHVRSSYPTIDQLQSPGEIRRFLVPETQRYLFEAVVKPLASIATKRPKQIGTESQRREATVSFIEDLREALEGDPVGTIVRCLEPELINTDRLQQNNDKPSPLITGWGFFAKDGFFPQMGKFLEKEVQAWGEAKRRKDLLVEKMKRHCLYYERDNDDGDNVLVGGEWNRKEEMQGKALRVFLDFLFEETGVDGIQVAQLLTPVLWPGQNWQTFLKEYLVTVDERFTEAVGFIPLAQRIYHQLYLAKQPLSTAKIAGALEKEPNAVFSALQALEQASQVKRLGGEKGDGEGRRVFWGTSEVIERYTGDPRYMSGAEKIMFILNSSDNVGCNFDEIVVATGLSESTVLANLQRSIYAAKIESRMERRRKDSRKRRYYYLL